MAARFKYPHFSTNSRIFVEAKINDKYFCSSLNISFKFLIYIPDTWVFNNFGSLCFTIIQTFTEFWYIFSTHISQSKDIKLILEFITNQYLDFLTARYITIKYGQHLCKQTLHCFGGFVTQTFYLENILLAKTSFAFCTS